MPIRPLENFTTAPSFNVSKKLTEKIKNSTKLKHNHSIKNNTDFVNKMKNIKIQSNYKLASFDIVDLYTNIPIQEILTILKANLINDRICNSKEVNLSLIHI